MQQHTSSDLMEAAGHISAGTEQQHLKRCHVQTKVLLTACSAGPMRTAARQRTWHMLSLTARSCTNCLLLHCDMKCHHLADARQLCSGAASLHRCHGNSYR